ncbi:MAG: META domain-containing protein, partial [Chthoniobacterales bacterium]
PLLLTITTSLAMETNQSSVTLPGSAWEVTAYAGQTPLADHPITFEFDTEGNIAGDASCNRFGGTCAIEGNTIKVGPLRSTRRACEPEIMQQEHTFLALLGSVATWQIDSDGVLVLIGEEGEIRAKKRTETPEN